MKQSPSTQVMDHLACKYLTFMLGREYYGLPVLKVREIIRMCDITPMPNVPASVKGVVNLRGKIIPVTDLRLKFSLTNITDTELTCIVVVQVRLNDKTTTLMGLIVDGVEEVVNLMPADIEPTPDFGQSTAADFILGIAKIKGVVKALLDIDQILVATHNTLISSVKQQIVIGVG